MPKPPKPPPTPTAAQIQRADERVDALGDVVISRRAAQSRALEVLQARPGGRRSQSLARLFNQRHQETHDAINEMSRATERLERLEALRENPAAFHGIYGEAEERRRSRYCIALGFFYDGQWPPRLPEWAQGPDDPDDSDNGSDR